MTVCTRQTPTVSVALCCALRMKEEGFFQHLFRTHRKGNNRLSKLSIITTSSPFLTFRSRATRGERGLSANTIATRAAFSPPFGATVSSLLRSPVRPAYLKLVPRALGKHTANNTLSRKSQSCRPKGLSCVCIPLAIPRVYHSLNTLTEPVL